MLGRVEMGEGDGDGLEEVETHGLDADLGRVAIGTGGINAFTTVDGLFERDGVDQRFEHVFAGGLERVVTLDFDHRR